VAKIPTRIPGLHPDPVQLFGRGPKGGDPTPSQPHMKGTPARMGAVSPPAVEARRFSALADAPVKGDTVGVRFDPLSASATVAQALRSRPSILPDASAPTAFLRAVAQPVVARAEAQLPAGLSPSFHVMHEATRQVITLPSGEVFVSSGQLLAAKDVGAVRQLVAREVASLAVGHAARRFVEAAAPEIESFASTATGVSAAASRVAERLERAPVPAWLAVDAPEARRLADDWSRDASVDEMSVGPSLEAAQRQLRLRAWVERPAAAGSAAGRRRVVVAIGALLFVLLARTCI